MLATRHSQMLSLVQLTRCQLRLLHPDAKAAASERMLANQMSWAFARPQMLYVRPSPGATQFRCLRFRCESKQMLALQSSSDANHKNPLQMPGTSRNFRCQQTWMLPAWPAPATNRMLAQPDASPSDAAPRELSSDAKCARITDAKRGRSSRTLRRQMLAPAPELRC